MTGDDKEKYRGVAMATGVPAGAATFRTVGTRGSTTQRSAEPVRHNLPVQLTSFVGREAELAQAKQLLAQVRLLTMVGPGGTGKTRLALQLAADVAEEFPDGVWLVELAPLADPAYVPHAVAAAAGVREEAERPLLDTTASALAAKQTLLVLDNCEHLVEACAAVADRLLRSCPDVKILATSRAPLHLSAEHELPVPPLPVPDITPDTSAAALAAAPSVSLFIQRARAVRPDFVASEDDLRRAADICRRLDGLPLAIELAAARSKLLSAQAILARLTPTAGASPLRLLASQARDLPARQQTLRDAIAWSYDLLTFDEQALFRRLAVFAGGCSLPAAEVVCGRAGDVLDGLESLVDKNLVKLEQETDGEPRFALLELVREFGLERLEAAGETVAAREAHATYFLMLAEEAAPRLGGPEQKDWVEQLAREQENLRGALAWLTARGAVRRGMRLATALCRCWELTARATEGRAALRQLLSVPAGLGDGLADGLADAEHHDYRRIRAGALAAAGALAYEQDDYAAAEAAYRESLALSEVLGDRRGIATALHGLANSRRLKRMGGDEARVTLFERALAIWRELGEEAETARTLYAMGTVMGAAGDQEGARAYLEESAAIRRALGDRQGLAWSLHLLGVTEIRQGNLDSAARIFEEGLATRRTLGDRLGVAYSLGRIVQIGLLRGDFMTVLPALEEAVAIALEFGDRWFLTLGLDYFAHLLVALGYAAVGVRVSGAADQLREELGVNYPFADRALHAAPLAAAREAQGAAGEVEWQAGRRLTLDEAIALGLAECRAAVAAAVAAGTAATAALAPVNGLEAGGLTRREREVAALVAEGLTNRQIAERLIISERTADTHVANILGKLGCATRAQVAVWAASHLPPPEPGTPAATQTARNT